MRRGGGVREAVALGAVLGTSVLLCASASAKMAQTITFTSSPPSPAVAGGSYEVSATPSSPVPVALAAEGACADVEPHHAGEQRLEGRGGESPAPSFREPSPGAVHFVFHFYRAGICTITGESWRPKTAAEKEKAVYEEYEPAAPVDQTFVVARDPQERVTFTSTPPSNATIGGSYGPSVLTSEALFISFFASPPSVCGIVVFPFMSTVQLTGAGTCTIIASQADTASEAAEAPEAKQSFDVSAPGNTNPTENRSPGATNPTESKTPGVKPPTRVDKAPTKVKRTPPKKRKKAAKGGIPAKVRAELLKAAKREAAGHPYGGRHLSDIQAVRTTEAQAERLEEEVRQLPSPEPPLESRSVYVVAMKGSFLPRCKGGSGHHTCAGATVFVLFVSASTRHVIRGETGHAYPNLESAGAPVPLEQSQGK